MPNIREVGHSSFLLDEKNLIDAGDVLGTLGEKSIAIETVWITHSHLDHIVDLAFIVDEYFEKRSKTLKIMAHKETIGALKAHVFNNIIWPDFSAIALSNGEMALSYEVVDTEKTYPLESGGKEIKAFVGDHTVASMGYIVSQEDRAILISSDTYSLEAVVRCIEENSAIHTLIVECSFPVRMEALAKVSKHLTPDLLFGGIASLESRGITLYINHIKHSYKTEIIKEIHFRKGQWNVNILEEGEMIDL